MNIILPLICLIVPIMSQNNSITTDIKIIDSNNFITDIKIIDSNNFIFLNSDDDYVYIVKNYKPENILYIDSPGGRIDLGLIMIDFVIEKNISCYAKRAYSMAFTIYNYCKERYYDYHSDFMHHEISHTFYNTIFTTSELRDYLNSIEEVENKFSLNSANKLGIPYEQFKELIKEDYYFKENMTFFREINMGQLVAII
jgi:hypothetical protein